MINPTEAVKMFEQQDEIIAELRKETSRLKEAVHLANGTADLALKHRDEAEKESLQLRADIAVQREALLDLFKALPSGYHARRDANPIGDTHICYHQVIDKALSTSPGNTLLSELAELRKDKERLDWLDKKRSNHIYDHFKYNQSQAATQTSWRAAIDKALDAQRQETKPPSTPQSR